MIGASARKTAAEWAARLGRSLLGATAGGLGAAVLDAAWASAAMTRGRAESAGALPVLLGDAGLVHPIALAVGAVVGAGAIALVPSRAPSVGMLVAELRLRGIGRPADVAAFVPLVVLAAFVWTTGMAHLARAVLALDAPPRLAGLAIATGAAGAGLLAGILVLALLPPLRQALANASETRRAWVDPAFTGTTALGVVACLVWIGVMTGGVSGEGGVLGVYGILKRPELDLRAPGMLLAIAFAALLAPAAIARFRGALAWALALAPLVLTARASVALDDVAIAQGIERGAPLGRPALAAFRRLSDRDGDGASARFGGGDCNDGDPNVGPHARDVPDNGVDEDCSGSDRSSAALASALPAAKPAAPARAAAARDAIVRDANIVLITVDTLRYDLGFMGYERPVSPNLDALAAKSTVFERAYALASYTGKSVGPMLIGKYGSETHRNWGHFNKFGEEDTFVAERLQRAGFRTMSVHGHRYFGKFGGLDRGFDVVDLSAAPPEGAAWDVDDTATSAKLTDAAIALLDAPETATKRFFLWLHYLDPHADYLKHDDVPSFGKTQRDLYDGEVAFTDKHIGRLLDALAKKPFGARTAIVVTSDHGEAFGEHKMYRHGFEVWEELVRVPLVVHVPGAKPSRVAARRSLVDLAPTLLDIAGVPPPPPPAAGDQAASDFFSGASLLPDVLLAPGEKPEERDVLVDMPAGPYNDARRALIFGDLKLTVSNEARFELYDLANDPGERDNLWRDPALREKAKLRYEATKARLREIRVTGKRK